MGFFFFFKPELGSGRVRVLCIPDSNPTRIHIIFIKKKFKTLVVYILSFPFRFHFLKTKPNPYLSIAPSLSHSLKLSLLATLPRPQMLPSWSHLIQPYGPTTSSCLMLPSRHHSTSPPFTSLTLTLVFSQSPFT